MLGICSACGNHEWDKEVKGNIIKCPKCGNERTFEKLPIYFLTGCSGIGKTTTAVELQKILTILLFWMLIGFVILHGRKMMKRKII